MPFYSPLRYPGGKRKLAGLVKLILEKNELKDIEYAEPYAGGAGIALALLLEGYASHIHLNDISRPIYAFWYSVMNHAEELCQRIRSTRVTRREWARQRGVLQNQHVASLLDLGFCTFFLNRTNRSGIIRGGIIGGKKQQGAYKLDARFRKDELIDRILRIHAHRGQISLHNKDAADFIKQDIAQLPPCSLTFFDPPYYNKGKELYEDYYEHDDHAEVAGLVSKISTHWLVTYDHVPAIVELYASYRRIVYALSYSATNRYLGAEVMIVCNELNIPSISADKPLNNSSPILRSL